MLEILTNTYILPAIIAIIGVISIYVYYRITKQTADYTNKDYARYFIIIYLCGVITLIASNFSITFINSTIQQGGASAINEVSNGIMDGIRNVNDAVGGSSVSFNIDKFQTGRPTF